MPLKRQFFRFSIIGSIAFVIDVGVLYFLHGRGLDLLTARVFSFLAAATFAWMGNRWFTFQATAAPLRSLPGEWLKYLLAVLLGGGVNYGIFALAIWQMEFVRDNTWIAVAMGTAGGMLVNFFLARKIFSLKRQL